MNVLGLDGSMGCKRVDSHWDCRSRRIVYLANGLVDGFLGGWAKIGIAWGNHKDYVLLFGACRKVRVGAICFVCVVGLLVDIGVLLVFNLLVIVYCDIWLEDRRIVLIWAARIVWSGLGPGNFISGFYGGDESRGCGVCSGRLFLNFRHFKCGLVLSRCGGCLGTVDVGLSGARGYWLAGIDHFSVFVLIHSLLAGGLLNISFVLFDLFVLDLWCCTTAMC